MGSGFIIKYGEKQKVSRNACVWMAFVQPRHDKTCFTFRHVQPRVICKDFYIAVVFLQHGEVIANHKIIAPYESGSDEQQL